MHDHSLASSCELPSDVFKKRSSELWNNVVTLTPHVDSIQLKV